MREELLALQSKRRASAVQAPCKRRYDLPMKVDVPGGGQVEFKGFFTMKAQRRIRKGEQVRAWARVEGGACCTTGNAQRRIRKGEQACACGCARGSCR